MSIVNTTDEAEQTRLVEGWQEGATPSTNHIYHIAQDMTPLSQSVLKYKRKSQQHSSTFGLPADQEATTAHEQIKRILHV